MYLLLLLLSFVTYLTYSWWKTRNLPPGPYGFPIVGYLPFINAKAPYKTLTELANKYGPIYGLYLGNVYTVVLSDVKLIKKVLAKDVTTGRAPLYLTHGIMKGYGKFSTFIQIYFVIKQKRKIEEIFIRFFSSLRIFYVGAVVNLIV